MTLGTLAILAAMFRPGDSAALDTQPEPGPFLFAGEELEYNVSYSFFDIGTIRFRVDSKERRGDRTVYRVTTFIDSNPSLSWLVDVHIRFYGVMDSSVYSHDWVGDDSTAKQVDFRTMNFDYAGGRMLYAKGVRRPDGRSEVVQRDTVPITGPSQDGMSLFFFARKNVLTTQEVNVPTFVDNKEGITRIRFGVRNESIEVDAVQYPVATSHFEGTASFVGVFGLTGDFEGWFSRDDARVPILARMKVLLGSVKIQLSKWKRGGWQPPRETR